MHVKEKSNVAAEEQYVLLSWDEQVTIAVFDQADNPAKALEKRDIAVRSQMLSRTSYVES